LGRGIKSLQRFVGDRWAKGIFLGAKLAELLFFARSITSDTRTSALLIGSMLPKPGAFLAARLVPSSAHAVLGQDALPVLAVAVVVMDVSTLERVLDGVRVIRGDLCHLKCPLIRVWGTQRSRFGKRAGSGSTQDVR